MSEEQSDKSGTDPEDSEENFNQADITDYRNYWIKSRPLNTGRPVLEV